MSDSGLKRPTAVRILASNGQQVRWLTPKENGPTKVAVRFLIGPSIQSCMGSTEYWSSSSLFVSSLPVSVRSVLVTLRSLSGGIGLRRAARGTSRPASGRRASLSGLFGGAG
jgi:hypothetical protein